VESRKSKDGGTAVPHAANHNRTRNTDTSRRGRIVVALCRPRGGSIHHKPCAILAFANPPLAGMAELADAADSKSAGPCGHGGSTPPPGTNKTKSLD
jgi:hypothetical protein